MASEKRIGILVEFNYEDMELWYPYYRLKEEGFNTFTIGPEKDKVYNSKHSYPCKAAYGIDDIKVQDLDALIIPGGFAPDYWRRDKRFLDLVKGVYEAGQPVAAICHGAWMFCSAKILQGKKLTCFVAIKDDVENAGGLYEDKSVVVDGNMITSRLPADLPDFCKAIIAQLK
ncbi:putative cysteine protease YraA [Patella vulgata]|uniref:putative cysteine protease YraA n=1 Tax=Patella vulgata TaxID=6465 RepID=UPI0024A8F871|nr:putative cysteine protease YraA [Patella vulgata]